MLFITIRSMRAFWRDRRGNVGMMFGVALIPMIGLAGIGIDLSRQMAAKTVLDAAADSAALAAATEAMAALQSSNSGFNNQQTAFYAATLAGQAMFQTNAAKIGQTIGGTPTPSVQISQSGQTITAIVTYSALSPNSFGGMFGSRTFPINGSAKSSLTLPKYMNISVAIDISQSMGLASTTDYQRQLQSVTGGCAFGCHAYQNGQHGRDSYEVQAHNASIPLRIDVIKQATADMINTAKQGAASTPLISFSLHTFGQSLTTLDSSSTAYTQLATDAGNIDLDSSTDTNGYGDTNGTANGTSAITQLTSKVPTSGTGASGSPQQFVFIMSDGVNDVYMPNASGCSGTFMWGHCTSPFDPAQCKALKDKGVTVGVIYTTYLAMPGVTEWENLVSPFSSRIAPAMQACASTGWYYEATQASDIHTAVKALFAQATGSGILTQ